MKKKILLVFKLALVVTLLIIVGLSACKKDNTVTPGEAALISFVVGDVHGTISESGKTVTAALAPGTDLTSVAPVITVSTGATVSPASGVTTNFTNPVVYTVTDKSGTVISHYTVTLTSAVLRKIAFIGAAAANTDAAWAAVAGPDYDLKDDQTAAKWFAANMPSSTTEVTYLSFKMVAAGEDLSKYHTLWIQFDGGWWGGEVAKFPNDSAFCLLNDNAPIAAGNCNTTVSAFISAIKTYYDAGGNIFFGNYAGSMVYYIGAVSKPEYGPNNSWGGLSVDSGATAGAWDVNWAASTSHPIFAGITLGGGCTAPSFIMLSSGTYKKNRSDQYNLDFGPWAPNGNADPVATRYATWQTMTGAKFLITNCGGNEGQMVEYAAAGTKGTIVSALSGTYDWYTGVDGSGNSLNTAGNIEKLTKNALNYLVDKNLKLIK